MTMKTVNIYSSYSMQPEGYDQNGKENTTQKQVNKRAKNSEYPTKEILHLASACLARLSFRINGSCSL